MSSKIQWTQETWNPTLGCSKVSPGCQECYAIKTVHRLSRNPNEKVAKANEGLTEKRGDRVEWTGRVNFIPERLEISLKRKKPTTYFVNSLSDLFHPGISDEQRDRIFAVMALTPQHTYQVLTKRPEEMLEYFASPDRHGKILLARKGEGIPSGLYPPAPEWPLSNVWLGVTVENQRAADERIPLLLQTPAAVRFLSCEPLLEEINFPWKMHYCICPGCSNINGDDGYNLDLQDCNECGESLRESNSAPSIDWVIVGGESGPNARLCDISWIRSIVEQCQGAGVPVFVKQMGARPFVSEVVDVWAGDTNQKHRREYFNLEMNRKGDNPDEWPEDLRVRQIPVTIPCFRQTKNGDSE